MSEDLLFLIRWYSHTIKRPSTIFNKFKLIRFDQICQAIVGDIFFEIKIMLASRHSFDKIVTYFSEFCCFSLFIIKSTISKINDPRIDLLYYFVCIFAKYEQKTWIMKRRMNTPNFNLRKADSTKETPIILIFRYGNYRLKHTKEFLI